MGEIINLVELGIAGAALTMLYKITTNHLHDISSKLEELTDVLKQFLSRQ